MVCVHAEFPPYSRRTHAREFLTLKTLAFPPYFISSTLERMEILATPLLGHVANGFVFVVFGLWHLFNNIVLYVHRPSYFTSPPWFKAPRLARYLELYLMILGSSLSLFNELVIAPRHQPFNLDGTIPSNHLQFFEHSAVAGSFLTYAVFAIILDRIGNKTYNELTYLLLAFAFSQELLLFHLHSADHMGVEGQYHWLLQLLILVSLVTTLMGINYPSSFLISFTRSICIFFQGVWFIIMGFMLWTPEFIPKGCFMNREEGKYVVRCENDHALHRAKSLVNLEFSWTSSMVIVFSVTMYIMIAKIYGKEVEYFSIGKIDEVEDIENMESQIEVFSESPSLIHPCNQVTDRKIVV